MIEKFALKLDEALYRTLSVSDWLDMSNDLMDMDILTETVENEVDYGTEAFR